jgi:hypothetical protein
MRIPSRLAVVVLSTRMANPLLRMLTVLAALALLLAAIVWARVWNQPSIESVKPAAGLTMGAFVLLAASLLISAAAS